MEKYIIEFYKKENGEEPAKEFILSLDAKMKAKFIRVIELLELNGISLRLPYSEYISDGIFEIRVKQGSNIGRVLYFFVSGKKIILANGFIKKTQKIPKKELELAKRYKKDYERRYRDD